MDTSILSDDSLRDQREKFTPADKLLLELVQQDIPLITRPYAKWAELCGFTETQVLERLHYFLESGFVREISVLLDKSKLGYKSTLVAAQIKEQLLERTANNINRHPGVSHNYLREHAYNLWFTLSIRQGESFQKAIESLLNPGTCPSFLVLEALKTFKLQVQLPFGTEDDENEQANMTNSSEQTGSAANQTSSVPLGAMGSEQNNRPAPPKYSEPAASPSVSEEEKIILRQLQNSFPLASQPFSELAIQAGLSEEHLLKVIQELKQKGIIRRIAGVVRHLKAGFLFNGLVCFALNPSFVLQAGAELAASPLVSHCYWRKSFPQWPYTLYTMVHTRVKGVCEQWAAREASRLNCPDYLLLFSSREYKKERVKLLI